jgi:Resolvase, N terminal domain
MAKIGYARCSSTSQDLSIQQERLRSVGCNIIRSEKLSGASRDGRDELLAIMEFVREGDELVVVKLDRLGRSRKKPRLGGDRAGLRKSPRGTKIGDQPTMTRTSAQRCASPHIHDQGVLCSVRLIK